MELPLRTLDADPSARWNDYVYPLGGLALALAPSGDDTERAVSSVYDPPEGGELQDIAYSGHYPVWGYSLAMEIGGPNDGEAQNTAIFRIFPGGLTEPVYVTKTDNKASFEVSIISGSGICVRYSLDSNGDETVDRVSMVAGGEPVIIRPGDAYSYLNTGTEDLVLRDVARPAFKEGDDAPLFTSIIPDGDAPEPKDGYSACIVATNDGPKTLVVPDGFYQPIYDQFNERSLA